jgi:hypothetical protein
MSKFFKQLTAASALIALSATSAQAACWTPAALSAAKVHDLEIMVKVAAKRCRAELPTMDVDYQNFVQVTRPAFADVNKTLRAHFVADSGLVDSFSAYNQYASMIAANYGASAEGLPCADVAAIIASALADGGSPAGLAHLADDVGASPILVGQRCSNRVTVRPAAVQQIAAK